MPDETKSAEKLIRNEEANGEEGGINDNKKTCPKSGGMR